MTLSRRCEREDATMKAVCVTGGGVFSVRVGTKVFAILRPGDSFGTNVPRDSHGNAKPAVEVPSLAAGRTMRLEKSDLVPGAVVWIVDPGSRGMGTGDGYVVWMHELVEA
jgi:hypothetical protein